MAAPTNYDQTNEWLGQLDQRVIDLINILKGGIDVGQSGTLGNLALVDDLVSAPIGGVAQFLNRLGALSESESDQRYLADIGSNNNGNYIVFPNGFTVVSRRVTITPGTINRIDFPTEFLSGNVWWVGLGGGWGNDAPTGGTGYTSRLCAYIGTAVAVQDLHSWAVRSDITRLLGDALEGPYDALLLAVGLS